ncbi:Oidioi.mRNA.OKI2018_I69.PAR.g9711.t1.cds [Oikopleura dioica]|uniref:Oidioi.mRNA.OKI2018_I69.PAR.g9711.t1.cds n=1 Tax=Oikopleura dioica TaxID=34765 RepID=A0ABN7RRC0_OIKDI|nr:Oidioi.mRNA.OKI2018_I69.PAR.g9711.t1.cds [Oikopleura dioica]
MSTADGGNFTDSSATVEHQAQFSSVMSELISARSSKRPALARSNTTAGCSAFNHDSRRATGEEKVRSRRSSKAGSRPISLAKELDLEIHPKSSTIDRKKSSDSPKPGGPKLSVCPSKDPLNVNSPPKPSPDMSKLPSMTSTEMSSSEDDGVFDEENQKLMKKGKDKDEDLEDIKIFERLGWFESRPVSYWWEILLVFINASTVLTIWLGLILNLFKEIVSINSKYFNPSVLLFSSLGLLHLLLLPIITDTLNVSSFLPYIKHSKTSITTRKLVRNWNSKWRIYFLNLVLPWNALFVQSNVNSQSNLLMKQIQSISKELAKEIKLKLINLRRIANEIVLIESATRNPFQLLIGYAIFLQLSSNPLSNASLTVDGKSAIIDKGLFFLSCYGLFGTSMLIFVCLCQYFVVWFESSFKKKLDFSIRWMMIFSCSCQIFLSLWFVRSCSMDIFKSTNASFYEYLFLTLKIFGLIFANFIPVFLFKQNRQDIRTFLRQIFVELLFYVPNFQKKIFLESGSETLRALFSHFLRCGYTFSIFFLLSSDKMKESWARIFENNFLLAESIGEVLLFCGPILWIVLIYYFLTDLECCKKISFVLFLSTLFSLLLCFIFLVVPSKNYAWETLFDFNF